MTTVAVLDPVLAATTGPALPPHPSLWENLQFQAVGLIIVLITLVGLYLLCAAVGSIFVMRARKAAADTGLAPPVPLVQADAVPVVVIAAAVAAALDEPHRILAVRPVQEVAWSMEGRRQLFASHQLSRRR